MRLEHSAPHSDAHHICHPNLINIDIRVNCTQRLCGDSTLTPTPHGATSKTLPVAGVRSCPASPGPEKPAKVDTGSGDHLRCIRWQGLRPCVWIGYLWWPTWCAISQLAVSRTLTLTFPLRVDRSPDNGMGNRVHVSWGLHSSLYSLAHIPLASSSFSLHSPSPSA